MKLKDIPLIIPKDWNEKKEIALTLEQYFIDFINKTGLEPIDAILELCERESVRVADIEDYIPLMNTLLGILKSKKGNVEDSFKGLF
jgi:hypothetical protein